ncbi:MAG TPA: hypothetical protein VFS23_09090, partial [Vicinamibacterales bacterium]|nr:hypothetical protein [Vicinamibacterales bacterium]
MMTHRALVSVAVSATITLVGLISVQLIAQSHASTETELTSSDGWNLDKHRALARMIQRQIGVKDGWQAPRTAWGHAELAGA